MKDVYIDRGDIRLYLHSNGELPENSFHLGNLTVDNEVVNIGKYCLVRNGNASDDLGNMSIQVYNDRKLDITIYRTRLRLWTLDYDWIEDMLSNTRDDIIHNYINPEMVVVDNDTASIVNVDAPFPFALGIFHRRDYFMRMLFSWVGNGELFSKLEIYEDLNPTTIRMTVGISTSRDEKHIHRRMEESLVERVESVAEIDVTVDTRSVVALNVVTIIITMPLDEAIMKLAKILLFRQDFEYIISNEVSLFTTISTIKVDLIK